MTTSMRARAAERQLADQRLSDLTLATAMVGVAATVGFAWLAAMTYAGTSSPTTIVDTGQDSSTRIQTDPSTGGGAATQPRPTAQTGSSGTLGGGSASNGGSTSNSGSTTNGGFGGSISRSNRHSHVSTGGS